MVFFRSSLREACQRLVLAGLLTQHPGRGLFVTRMDAATMSDFIDYRLGIEMQAATIVAERAAELRAAGRAEAVEQLLAPLDRKSTRLNSSHVAISYAVFCLKKKT